MRRVALFIDNISRWSSRVVSPLVLVMMVVVIYEVVSRSFFNKPTIWAHEMTTFAWGAMFIVGGAYTFLDKRMVNVDIILVRFPPKIRSAIEAFNFLPLVIVCLAVIWYGTPQAWKSIVMLEKTQTVFSPPVYPLRALIPISAFLLLLQGVSKLIDDVYFTFRGRGLK